MADFGPDISDQVLQACEAGAADASEVLSTALGQPLTLTSSGTVTMDAENPAVIPGERGLIVLLQVGEAAAVLAIPESTEVLPDWYREPDDTQSAKLSTLALELGETLLPEEFRPTQCSARSVTNLSEAIQRGRVGESGVRLSLALQPAEGKPGELPLVWPITRPEHVLEPQEEETSKLHSYNLPDPPRELPTTVAGLPTYAQSLLRIQVPVMAILASRKQPVEEVLDLSPGTLIHFDKSCDQLLELEAGGQLVAKGDAVKVGDKFGLRIKEIVLPDERFKKVG